MYKNREARLAAIQERQSQDTSDIGAKVDEAMKRLIRCFGNPTKINRECDKCEKHRTALVTYLRADLDGYLTPEPTAPKCWTRRH